MKFIFVFLSIFIFSSCANQPVNYNIHTKSSPSWVQLLREGEHNLKINQADKVLFRARLAADGRKPSDLCQKTIDQNISYIRKSFPFAKQIPMNIELVYFDKNVGDCSTTLSIDRPFVEKLTKMNLILKRDDEVNQQLKLAEEQNLKLKNKIKNLEQFLSKNKKDAIKAEKLGSKAEKLITFFHYKTNKIAAIHNQISCGFDYKDLIDIAGKPDSKISYNYYIKQENKRYGYLYGAKYGTRWPIWNSQGGYLGFCNSNLTKDCFSKAPSGRDFISNKFISCSTKVQVSEITNL